MEAKKLLIKFPNVIAVGFGYKQIDNKIHKDIPAIVFSVIKKLPESQLRKKDVIPKQIERFKTDVIETGVIRALKARTDRWRPAPGGVSIGHEWITAGTLGCLVSKGGNVYILSNNHVLADSNNAPLGSAILQPGKYDGGEPIDRIASLSEFVPIEFLGGEGCEIGQAVARAINLFAKVIGSKTRLNSISVRQVSNLVDAAIACPIKEDMVKNEILEIGKIMGMAEATLGLPIQKSGRTTALTKGEITQIDVTVKVQYGENKIAMFEDQIMAGKMCQGGDSGSLVVSDVNNLAVGLLFAGSDNSTIINKINHVCDALKISFLGEIL